MKTRGTISLLLAAVSLAACDRSSDQLDEQTDVVANDAPVPEVIEVDCPAVDDAGNIDIAPGLKATVLTKGHGRAAMTDDYADVHTTLWLYDESAEGGRGDEIWTSGGVQPFQFQLGSDQVIKGWGMGVPCMLVGETRELVIAGDLAYGPDGRAPIPPNATLLFNIELVELTSPNQ